MQVLPNKFASASSFDFRNFLCVRSKHLPVLAVPSVAGGFIADTITSGPVVFERRCDAVQIGVISAERPRTTWR